MPAMMQMDSYHRTYPHGAYCCLSDEALQLHLYIPTFRSELQQEQ